MGDDSQTQTCVTPGETTVNFETFCRENETCPGSHEWGCRATVNVGDNKLRLRHLALVASLILSLFYSDFLLHDKFLIPLRCANDLRLRGFNEEPHVKVGGTSSERGESKIMG